MRGKDFLRRLSVLGALSIVVAVPAVATAGHDPDPARPEVASYTGCVTSRGNLVNVAVDSTTPLGGACPRNSTEAHFSGGDITSVAAGAGLTGGGDNGAVSLAVPQGHGSGLDADTVDGVHAAGLVQGTGRVHSAERTLTVNGSTAVANLISVAGFFDLVVGCGDSPGLGASTALFNRSSVDMNIWTDDGGDDPRLFVMTPNTGAGSPDQTAPDRVIYQGSVPGRQVTAMVFQWFRPVVGGGHACTWNAVAFTS